MKWLIVILLFVFLQSETCKNGSSMKIPSCIAEKIEAIRQQPKYNPPASVYRYQYAGQYVYLISSNCCDQYNYVYDKSCNIICAPSGGITGKGDARCSNFNEMATEETLVWKDER
jgi:hypothetical protein